MIADDIEDRDLDAEEAELVEDLWSREPYDPAEEHDYFREDDWAGEAA